MVRKLGLVHLEPKMPFDRLRTHVYNQVYKFIAGIYAGEDGWIRAGLRLPPKK